MAKFKYVGFSPDGKKLESTIEAESIKDARKLLRRQNIRATKVLAPSFLEVDLGQLMADKGLSRPFGQAELMRFTRQLSILINAGVPILECMEILHKQEPNMVLKRVIKNISMQIEEGKSLFESMSNQSGFDKLYCALVKAGESAGILDSILVKLAEFLEKAEKLKAEVKSSKDSIQSETYKIDGIKTANENVQRSIDSLGIKSSAWENKKNDDLEKLGKAILQLESVDIEAELQAHIDLKAWTENNKKINDLNKQRATLETAVNQAEKTVKKYAKDLESLANKKCHACEQELHDHKHEEMTATAATHLTEAQTYFDKVNGDYNKIVEELGTGDREPRPPMTFYETEAEALGHKNNLASLENSLQQKFDEINTYEEQIV